MRQTWATFATGKHKTRYATPQKLENAANWPPDTYSMPFLSLILFPARIVPDGRRQGAAFGLSLDGEAELAERLFENFHTYWWIGKIRIASHAGQDFLADGKNHHGTGIPKAEPDSMEHGVYTVLNNLYCVRKRSALS